MKEVTDYNARDYLKRGGNIFDQPELAFLTADPADSDFWMAHFHQLGRYVSQYFIEQKMGDDSLSLLQEELVDNPDRCRDWLQSVVGTMAYDQRYQIRTTRGGKRSNVIELPTAILDGYIKDPLLIFYAAKEKHTFSQNGNVMSRKGVPLYSTWKNHQIEKIRSSRSIGASSFAAELSYGRTVAIPYRRG